MKAKKVSKVKKIRKVKKVKKIKRVKKKPVLDPTKITVSKAEMIFQKFLLDIGVDVTPQHQLGYKFFDFLVKGTKILVEFQGSYWHCDPELYPNGPEDAVQKKNMLNDIYKRKLALSNGYELLEVWEHEFKTTSKTRMKNKILKFIKEAEKKKEKNI